MNGQSRRHRDTHLRRDPQVDLQPLRIGLVSGAPGPVERLIQTRMLFMTVVIQQCRRGGDLPIAYVAADHSHRSVASFDAGVNGAPSTEHKQQAPDHPQSRAKLVHLKRQAGDGVDRDGACVTGAQLTPSGRYIIVK